MTDAEKKAGIVLMARILVKLMRGTPAADPKGKNAAALERLIAAWEAELEAEHAS